MCPARFAGSLQEQSDSCRASPLPASPCRTSPGHYNPAPGTGFARCPARSGSLEIRSLRASPNQPRPCRYCPGLATSLRSQGPVLAAGPSAFPVAWQGQPTLAAPCPVSPFLAVPRLANSSHVGSCRLNPAPGTVVRSRVPGPPGSLGGHYGPDHFRPPLAGPPRPQPCLPQPLLRRALSPLMCPAPGSLGGHSCTLPPSPPRASPDLAGPGHFGPRLASPSQAIPAPGTPSPLMCPARTGSLGGHCIPLQTQASPVQVSPRLPHPVRPGSAPAKSILRRALSVRSCARLLPWLPRPAW